MNYNLKDVKGKLQEIQKSKNEPTLFGYLQQLFITKEYIDVQINHGTSEYGKDLVFADYNKKLGVTEYYAVVVKNKDSGMQDFEEAGEVRRQIDLSFNHPYMDSEGVDHQIAKVIVVINGSISVNARTVLQKSVHPSRLANIHVWDL